MSKPTLSCGYLYSTGHAILLFEKDDQQAGRVQWCEVVENYGPRCNFKGRIVFHNPKWDALFNLAKKAQSVSAKEACTKNGSENTQRMGIDVGYIELGFKDGTSLHYTTMPSIISNGTTYQPNAETEGFESLIAQGYWSSRRIAKVHRSTKELESIAA